MMRQKSGVALFGSKLTDLKNRSLSKIQGGSMKSG
ncbi:MAG: hypothetical protein PWP44_1571 [Thermacetogenium sp.]|nr:hypothetical protein [Thermacetogenium sp.]